MRIDRSYAEFIQSIQHQIVQSRYAAAKLTNREQLLLCYKTGLMISEKIKAQKGVPACLSLQLNPDFAVEILLRLPTAAQQQLSEHFLTSK